MGNGVLTQALKSQERIKRREKKKKGRPGWEIITALGSSAAVSTQSLSPHGEGRPQRPSEPTFMQCARSGTTSRAVTVCFVVLEASGRFTVVPHAPSPCKLLQLMFPSRKEEPRKAARRPGSAGQCATCSCPSLGQKQVKFIAGLRHVLIHVICSHTQTHIYAGHNIRMRFVGCMQQEFCSDK